MNKMFKRLSILAWHNHYHNWLNKLYKNTVIQIWVENPYITLER